MTHDLDYMLQVMKAAKNGKVIQFCKSNGVWEDVVSPKWNWRDFDYRVKVEPKYVPYETAEEFIQDQQKHGMYFTDKGRSDYYLPSCVSSNKNNIGVSGEGYYLVFATLFRNYVWQDGSPCGKLEE